MESRMKRISSSLGCGRMVISALLSVVPAMVASSHGSMNTTRPSCRVARTTQPPHWTFSCGRMLTLALLSVVPAMVASSHGSMNTTRPSCQVDRTTQPQGLAWDIQLRPHADSCAAIGGARDVCLQPRQREDHLPILPGGLENLALKLNMAGFRLNFRLGSRFRSQSLPKAAQALQMDCCCGVVGLCVSQQKHAVHGVRRF